MSKGYRFFMLGCGAAALTVGSTYAVVVAIALGDGIGQGVEVPREISMVSVSLFLIASILSGGAWLVDRSAKDSARRDLGPALESTVERIAPELASVVSIQVASRTAAALREVTTGEIAEMIDAGLKRAFRSGAIFQAQAEGTISSAKVVKMRLPDDPA